MVHYHSFFTNSLKFPGLFCRYTKPIREPVSNDDTTGHLQPVLSRLNLQECRLTINAPYEDKKKMADNRFLRREEPLLLIELCVLDLNIYFLLGIAHQATCIVAGCKFHPAFLRWSAVVTHSHIYCVVESFSLLFHEKDWQRSINAVKRLKRPPKGLLN